MSSRPAFKPRNAPRTKAAILAAAQKAFSEHGYAQANVRDIATAAGVSAPMLLRYFGSKAGLFEAALFSALPLDWLLRSKRDQFGAHVARLFFDLGMEIQLPSILALSNADPETRDITARFTQERVLDPLAEWLGPPDDKARALEILLLAIAFAHYMASRQRLPVTKSLDAKLVKWFARSVQAIVDQS